MKNYIFISYSMRDKNLTIDDLVRVKHTFLSCDISTYIDIIDNKNFINPQKDVINKLVNSKCLLILNYSHQFLSPWVRLELNIACLLGKKIFEWQDSSTSLYFDRKQNNFFSKLPTTPAIPLNKHRLLTNPGHIIVRNLCSVRKSASTSIRSTRCQLAHIAN